MASRGGGNLPLFISGPGTPYDILIDPDPSDNTTQIRQLMVNEINAVGRTSYMPPGSFTAALDFTDPYCPGWDTSMSLEWSGPESFYIEVSNAVAANRCFVGKDDGVSSTYGICSVNPDFVQAAGPNPPPPLPPTTPIPTLSQWATGILVLLMATSMVWILRRRRDEVG